MKRLLPGLTAALAVVLAGCAGFDRPETIPDDLEFHNLKVLPVNIQRDDLIRTMRGFARDLGTRCDHCHVRVTDDPKAALDFPNDAKPEKNAARAMIRMTQAMNDGYMSKLADADARVTCGTCHRGHTKPEPWNPPPLPEEAGAH